MDKLGRLFKLLKDHRQHGLSEISEELNVPLKNLKKAVELLAEENIVLYNNKEERIKINPEWSFLLEN